MENKIIKTRLSEEIKKFKADFKPQYDDYLAERERIAEQERQKQLQETHFPSSPFLFLKYPTV